MFSPMSAFFMGIIVNNGSLNKKVSMTVQRVLLLSAALLAVSGNITALEKVSIGLEAAPCAIYPVGNKAENYSIGIGARIEALIGSFFRKTTTPYLDLGYAFVPLSIATDGLAASTNLTLTRGGIGIKPAVSVSDRFSLRANGHVSGYYAALTGDQMGSAIGISMGVGGSFGLQFSPRMLLSFGINYDNYLDLYSGITVWLGSSIRLSGRGNNAIPKSEFLPYTPGALPEQGFIRFSDIQLDRVFPVLYKYYDEHPIGTATIVNAGRKPVEDVVLKLKLKQYMDTPKVSARIERCEPGEKKQVPIYALFTEDILSVTEGAKVAAEITTDYLVDGRKGIDCDVITLNTYSRNALTWDDDRKIAAFVTARDEEVQRFARNVAAVFETRGIKSVSREIQLGMLFLSAMAEHHCTYVVDPTSPYSDFSGDSTSVDSVQFPRQTLQYRAGDCDDLSVAYTALLEAVGIETAFITVPGHIFTAFRLDMSSAEAKQFFENAGDIIEPGDGTTWIPVETTFLKKGFLSAWQEGARQWRQYEGENGSALLPTRSAWSIYEPVAFGVSDYQIEVPSIESVGDTFGQELDSFISRQIMKREQYLLGLIKADPDDYRIMNRLGVLYASYGMYEQGMMQFESVLKIRDYIPAQVNAGNILYLYNEYHEAGNMYRQVLEADPDNHAALLGAAKCCYALNDHEGVILMYSRLAETSPRLAERFSYLGAGKETATRASDSTWLTEKILWEAE